MEKRKKQLLALLLAGAMVVSGCGSSSTETSESSASDSGTEESVAETVAETTAETETEETGFGGSAFADEEKPTLKILTAYQSYSYEDQPANVIVTELSGYTVEWYMLPSENADEKLLLEIASGADYDIIWRASQSQFSQLAEQGALLTLDDLLEEYGQELLGTGTAIAWEAVKDSDGNTVGIPMESAMPTKEDYFGVIQGGIGVRSDVLEELGLEIPETLDEFTEFLRTIKEELGIVPYTSTSAFDAVILSAFGMGSATWYDVDGTYTHRIKHPQIAEYLEYMQMLYAEGLLDTDMPINTSSNAQEKFTSGTAASLSGFMFYDTDVLSAVASSTEDGDATVEVITWLAADEDTTPTIWISKGIQQVTCITKNCENPEYAIDFMNTISQYDNYKRIYIGEEGVSYEVNENGGYSPIFSGEDGDFSSYTNSDKFTMVNYPGDSFEMWTARARKTDAMAELFDELNTEENLSRYTAEYTIEDYGTVSAEVTEYYTQLKSDFSDAFKNAIVNGTDPEEAIAEMQATWDANGGMIVEAAMQEFYDANKDLLE